MKKYTFHINPVSKPRMTQQDKWIKRKCTSNYWYFKEQIKYIFRIYGLKTLPSVIFSIVFYIPMPKSWSNIKRDMMRGTNHKQKPDIDNLLKGLMDALCKNDEYISEITAGLKKVWSDNGKIIIEF